MKSPIAIIAAIASAIAAAIAYVTLVVAFIVGWVSNLIWLFTHSDITGELILAIVGLFLVPIGATHGLYVLF